MARVKPCLAAATSRREALSAGGLTIAGATGGLASTRRPRIIFGANRNVYLHFNAAIPLAKAVRVYYDGENQFPVAWPNRLPGAWMTLSLRPNPHDLLSGRLDDQLHAIIRSAPAHSELAFWHENIPGNPLDYPSYVNNPLTARRMQRYGQWLCRGTQVRFGVIICGPAVQMPKWIAPHLDWYGFDFYDNWRYHNKDGTLSKEKMFARMNNNFKVFRAKSGVRWPAIRICEGNSPEDSHRVNWFTYCAQWMAGHNGRRYMTYWNPDKGAAQNGLSGPWPPSAPVVRRLHLLSEAFRGSAG
jgi:hypothetical protein